MPIPIELPFSIPSWGYYIVHGLEVLLGLIFGIRYFRLGSEYKLIGTALMIYMLAGITNLLYHTNILTNLFAHVIDRALLLIAIILIGLSAKRFVI